MNDDKYPTRIAAFDPGSRVVGYAIMECPTKPRIVEAGIIRLDASRGRLKQSLAGRLGALRAEIDGLLRLYGRLDSAAVEGVYSRFPGDALVLAQARGVILAGLGLARVRVDEYAATTVKKRVTGSGRADKAAVRAAVNLQYPELGDRGPTDVADALALGLCHCASLVSDERIRAAKKGYCDG